MSDFNHNGGFGFIGTPNMGDIQRLQARVAALEERLTALENPTYVPPAVDPTLLLRGNCCEHVAAEHGFKFNRKDGSITLGAACQECDCPGFTQWMPAQREA